MDFMIGAAAASVNIGLLGAVVVTYLQKYRRSCAPCLFFRNTAQPAGLVSYCGSLVKRAGGADVRI